MAWWISFVKKKFIAKIKDHIRRFPRIESHYCRKNSKREYLESELSIKVMHKLYLKQCSTEDEKVKEFVYRRIFCNDFNYGFWLLRKYQCNSCDEFNKINPTDLKLKIQRNMKLILNAMLKFRIKSNSTNFVRKAAKHFTLRH